MKQLNNNMRTRANDPPGPDKGDPNKVWCCKTIDNVTFGELDAFKIHISINWTFRLIIQCSYLVRSNWLRISMIHKYKSMKILFHIVPS